MSGVPVWRIDSPFADTADSFVASQAVASQMGGHPGRWFPTDPQALADMRHAVAQLFMDYGWPTSAADEDAESVLRALGLAAS